MIDDGALEEKVRAICPEGVDKGLELIGTLDIAGFPQMFKIRWNGLYERYAIGDLDDF